MNIDNIIIKTSDADDPNIPSLIVNNRTDSNTPQYIYSINGQKINSAAHGIVIINGKKMLKK